MFKLMKQKNPAETHGRYKSLILASEEIPPNVNLNYETGYVDNTGNFILIGNDTIFLKDIEEIKEEDGTIIPAKLSYSEFMILLKSVMNEEKRLIRNQMLEKFILSKLIEKEQTNGK